MNKDIQQQPSRSHRAGQQRKEIYHKLHAIRIDEYVLNASKRAVRAQRRARVDREYRKALAWALMGFVFGIVFMGVGGIF